LFFLVPPLNGEGPARSAGGGATPQLRMRPLAVSRGTLPRKRGRDKSARLIYSPPRRYHLFRMLRRYLLRPLWVVLALLFLMEAWLWDHLQPVVAKLVALIPLEALKRAIARAIAGLPPWAVLFVFAVPLIALLPLKVLEVYFLATRNWLGAVAVILFVKLAGLGITAFIFDVTRDKLMQMAWFRRVYGWVMWARDWAHAQTEPIRRRIRQYVRLLKPKRAGTVLRRLMRLRRRAYRRWA